MFAVNKEKKNEAEIFTTAQETDSYRYLIKKLQGANFNEVFPNGDSLHGKASSIVSVSLGPITECRTPPTSPSKSASETLIPVVRSYYAPGTARQNPEAAKSAGDDILVLWKPGI